MRSQNPEVRSQKKTADASIVCGPSSIFAFACLLLLPISTQAQFVSDADFDASGKVDFADFLEFAGAFGSTESRFDLDGSGKVDFPDFLSFAGFFGQTVPVVDCGNAVGNGLEIIDGPDGPVGADFDQPFRSLTVHPDNPNTILIGTERNGFLKSADGGVTWSRHRSGLRHFNGGYPEIWDIAWDPVDTTCVYAATLDSPGPVLGDLPSSGAGFYRSADGGDTWERANCGLTSSRITSVQVLPSTPSVLIAGVEGGEASFASHLGEYFAGGIYRSPDRGDSWDRIDVGENDGLNGYWRIIALADSLDGFVTYGVNHANSSQNVGFIRSLDAGESWLPFAEQIRGPVLAGFDVSADGSTIYANERDSFFIQVSTDGGRIWSTTDLNQASGPLVMSPLDADLVLYSARDFLHRSADALQTDEVVLDAGATIMDIVFAPSDPSIVYVISEGYLLYRSEDGGQSFGLVRDIRSEVLSE